MYNIGNIFQSSNFKPNVTGFRNIPRNMYSQEFRNLIKIATLTKIITDKSMSKQHDTSATEVSKTNSEQHEDGVKKYK